MTRAPIKKRPAKPSPADSTEAEYRGRNPMPIYRDTKTKVKKLTPAEMKRLDEQQKMRTFLRRRDTI